MKITGSETKGVILNLVTTFRNITIAYLGRYLYLVYGLHT
jgi:hypothetical protein